MLVPSTIKHIFYFGLLSSSLYHVTSCLRAYVHAIAPAITNSSISRVVFSRIDLSSSFISMFLKYFAFFNR